jgi:CRISPR-associated protein Csd1
VILRALYELAEHDHLLDDLDFENKPVAYLVRIGDGGRLLGIESTRPAPEEGSKRRPEAKRFPVPREPKRTSGDRALLLVDKAEYVFGIDPDGERPAAKLAVRHRLFRERVEEALAANGDEGLKAIAEWLAALDPEGLKLPDDVAANDLFGLMYGEETDLAVHRPAVSAWWAEQRQEAGGPEARCLVTGKLAPTALLHTVLKGVPNAQSSGVPLVSFNAAAFESYGWKSNENAPVSRRAAEGYATALRRLLDRNPDEGGIRHRVLSKDTVVCWWAPGEDGGFSDALAGLLDANPDAVAELFQSVWKGQPPPKLDPQRFYGLTLTGSQGRIVVRAWLETTVASAAQQLADWYADLDIVRLTPPPKDGGHPPGFALARLGLSLAVRGDRKRLPPHLPATLFSTALGGGPLPIQILQRALLRTRAEIGDTSWTARDRRDHLAALIKAYLRRRRHQQPDLPEIKPTMDETNTRPGYLLGRLMAILERLQQHALGDINASVIDRFFATASAAPQAVFPRLLKGARHHAKKVRDDSDKKGYGVHLERMLDSVLVHFPADAGGLPAHLALDEQGMFLLGYHHQRHAFFQKRQASDGERERAVESSATA